MSKRETISVEGYVPVQPIPPAARKGPLVVTGGVEGIDPTTRKIAPETQDQVDLTFANLERVLGAAGAGWGDVVKLTFSVSSDDVRPLINEHWLRIFPEADDRPARQVVPSAALPAGVVIQCVAMAWVD